MKRLLSGAALHAPVLFGITSPESLYAKTGFFGVSRRPPLLVALPPGPWGRSAAPLHDMSLRLNGRPRFALMVLALPLLLAACAHQRPVGGSTGLELPAHWGGSVSAATMPATDLAAWWLRFGDAELSRQVEIALQASPSVQSALAALRQSRALADVAAAGLLPSLDGSAGAQRTHTRAQGGANAFNLGLAASWEPDLFGGARAGVSAAEADARAAQMSLANVQVALAAEVALAYIDLRSAQTRLAIAQSSLATQEDTLQIARWRSQAGLVSSLDVEQAITAAEQTRASVPQLQTTLAQARHRLAVLSGRAPGELGDLAGLAGLGSAPVPLPPDDLALAFPADTLRQRPDVRQSEARVEAAWARLAQADATRYPTLGLSGSLGLQALTLGTLTSSGSVVRSIVASLSAPLFDGGVIAGNIRAQEAALEQARADYRSSVLTALQDVEDALVALQGDRERSLSLATAAQAAANADVLARQQYQAGLVDFRTVLETQRSLLSAQDGAASVRASLAADHVSLYKALGGGWQPELADVPTGSVAETDTAQNPAAPPATR